MKLLDKIMKKNFDVSKRVRRKVLKELSLGIEKYSSMVSEEEERMEIIKNQRFVSKFNDVLTISEEENEIDIADRKQNDREIEMLINQCNTCMEMLNKELYDLKKLKNSLELIWSKI